MISLNPDDPKYGMPNESKTLSQPLPPRFPTPALPMNVQIWRHNERYTQLSHKIGPNTHHITTLQCRKRWSTDSSAASQ